MKIVYAPEAVEDLKATAAYLAERSPAAARRLSDRVFETVRRLARREFEGPEREQHSGELVRSWPVYPLRIYYQRGPDAFHVLRVFHESRKPISR